MKKKGHPPYQEILFVDTATGHKFVCGSTLQPKEKEMFEGKEYPVYRVPISSSSHPFFTGSQQFIDTEGRVDKFRKRYGAVAKDVPQGLVESAPKQKSADKKPAAKPAGKAAPAKAAQAKAPAAKAAPGKDAAPAKKKK